LSHRTRRLARVVALSLSAPLLLASSAVAADAAPAVRLARTPAHTAGGVVLPTARVSAAATLAAQGGTHRLLAGAPASVDLRASGFLPAVGDQGAIGSCSTWSLAYTTMGYYAARDGDSGAPFSPLYLYDLKVMGPAPSAGTNPDVNLTELATNGVDTQDDFFQGNYAWQTPVTPTEKANAANYKVTSWQRLWAGPNQGVAARTLLTSALAAGNPVPLAFNVYDGFFGIRDGKVYTPNTGTNHGGHMVTAVGYDADGIVIRNQWGTGWGDRGDARLSWAFVQQNVLLAYTISGVTSPADRGTPLAPAPAVVSLSASTGPTTGGGKLVLTGSNLRTATAVTVGGTPATFSVRTDGGATRLEAVVPAHAAGAAAVQVVSTGGTSAASPAAVYTYTAPPPAVTALSAPSVSTAGGTVVTLTGTGLAGATGVTVGGVAATGLVRTADTSMSFTVPAHAPGTGDVVVTTPAGRSAASAAARLTWVAPAAPVVTKLSTATGSTLAPTVVTVTGTGLAQVRGATVAGTPVTVKVVSDTTLTVTVPAHAAGAGKLVLTAAWTRSAETAVATFTWVVPAPTLAAAGAASVPAGRTAVVTLTGTGLTGARSLTVGGRPATGLQVLSPTQVRVTVPALPAGGYPVVVTTPGGPSTTPLTLRYTA